MTAAELAALKDDYAHALARGDYETAANIAVSLLILRASQSYF